MPGEFFFQKIIMISKQNIKPQCAYGPGINEWEWHPDTHTYTHIHGNSAVIKTQDFCPHGTHSLPKLMCLYLLGIISRLLINPSTMQKLSKSL